MTNALKKISSQIPSTQSKSYSKKASIRTTQSKKNQPPTRRLRTSRCSLSPLTPKESTLNPLTRHSSSTSGFKSKKHEEAPNQFSRALQALSPLLLLCFAGTVCYLCIVGNHGLLYLDSLNNRLEEISDKNNALVSEIFDVRYQIRAVEQQGLQLEKKAREELGLSREGETVYMFEN